MWFEPSLSSGSLLDWINQEYSLQPIQALGHLAGAITEGWAAWCLLFNPEDNDLPCLRPPVLSTGWPLIMLLRITRFYFGQVGPFFAFSLLSILRENRTALENLQKPMSPDVNLASQHHLPSLRRLISERWKRVTMQFEIHLPWWQVYNFYISIRLSAGTNNISPFCSGLIYPNWTFMG